MSIKKICINCEHFYKKPFQKPRCARNFDIDPVFGKSLSTLECEIARSDVDDCGPEGRHWLPRHDHKTFILCAPQAVGKTRNAEALFSALRCVFLIDDWNGADPLRPGTLAITNAEYTMPKGGVAFHVEDECGLDALVQLLST